MIDREAGERWGWKLSYIENGGSGPTPSVVSVEGRFVMVRY